MVRAVWLGRHHTGCIFSMHSSCLCWTAVFWPRYCVTQHATLRHAGHFACVHVWPVCVFTSGQLAVAHSMDLLGGHGLRFPQASPQPAMVVNMQHLWPEAVACRLSPVLSSTRSQICGGKSQMQPAEVHVLCSGLCWLAVWLLCVVPRGLVVD